tara:strand:+ start:1381 stop:1584 length:204 start_codon:yes stop_codon:yes gene_type:complete
MNQSITKPVSEKNKRSGYDVLVLNDKCNVFLWLALKENWGKILVAIGNSKRLLPDFDLPYLCYNKRR